MNQHPAERLLWKYVDRSLSEDNREWIRLHCNHCDDCHGTLSQILVLTREIRGEDNGHLPTDLEKQAWGAEIMAASATRGAPDHSGLLFAIASMIAMLGMFYMATAAGI